MKTKLSEIRERLIEDIDDFESEFKKFHSKELRHAQKRGGRDGVLNKPAPDSNAMNTVEREIYQSYSAQISELARDFQGPLIEIKTEYINSIEQQLSEFDSEKIKNKVDQIRKDRDAELAGLEREYRLKIEQLQKHPELVALNEKYDEADDNYLELAEKLGRKDTNAFFNWPKRWYYFVLIFIGLVEVAANYGMFLNFEEPPYITWTWAIGFGVVVSLVAHFNGILFAKCRFSRPYCWVGGLISIIVLAGIYFLARFRMDTLPDDIPGKFLSEEVFIFVSIVLYIAALFLSFMSHDSHPEFVRAIKKREKAREELEKKNKATFEEINKLKADLQKAESEVAQKYESQIKELLDKEDYLKYLKHDATALYDEILQGLKNMEMFIVQKYFEALQTYRSCNARRRTEAEPEYWNNQLAQLPTKFEQLSEIDSFNKNKNPLWNSENS